MIKFVLHRPRSSQTIGSPRRALSATAPGRPWGVVEEGGGRAGARAREEEQAEEKRLGLVREQARSLLPAAGFLNPQQPDAVLDELLQLLRRSRPTKREAEMLLTALAQIERRQMR